MAKFVSIECDGVGEAIEVTQQLNATGFDAQFMSSLVGKPSVVVRKPWSTRSGAHTAQIAASIEDWLADTGREASLVVDGDALRVEATPAPSSERPSAAAARA